MEKIDLLKRLQYHLPAERFIIGGSNAMKLHGISIPKEPQDLDIILEFPRPEALERLEHLQNENPNPKFTGRASMVYSFYTEDVKVDVWIKNELSPYPLLSYEGILINSITDIVAAKKEFNRAKDWMQLMQWSTSIFDKNRFESILMEIGVSENYDLTNADDAKKPHDPLASPPDEWDEIITPSYSSDQEDDLPF